MKIKELFLGIMLCVFFTACDGTDKTADVLSLPFFGTETIDDQQYIINSVITPLTLPESTGGIGNLSYSMAPVPDGMSFDSSTRTLSGTPTATGSTDVTYTAQDADGNTSRLTFNVSVRLPGICGRTQEVQNAILTEVQITDSTVICSTVTKEHLAGITELDLSYEALLTPPYTAAAITALQEGDFDGLSGLTSLDLRQVPLFSQLQGISVLPENLFKDLTSLTTLDLSRNSLSSVPAGLFDRLSSLETLNLRTNSLATLPEDVFEGLSNLRRLDLSRNSLLTVPADLFDGLSSLTRLDLSHNDQTVVPSICSDPAVVCFI